MHDIGATAVSRFGLAAVFILALIGLALAGPGSVAACSCAMGGGLVTFTGTAVDGPTWDTLYTSDGVYTFTVDNVIRGDVGDGRVWAGHACGEPFDLGHRYLVHADRVDPTGPYLQRQPQASLVSGMCYTNEDKGIADPIAFMRGVAFTFVRSPVDALAFLAIIAFLIAGWRSLHSGASPD